MISKEHGIQCSFQYALFTRIFSLPINLRVVLSYLDWLNEISTASVMALYWKQIVKLQTHTLIYIRSIRESNFQLHILALRALIKWYFTLDHYNYSRWVTVHLFDLVNLEQQHPDVYENFCKGYFSFKKSCSEFSTRL